MPRRKVRDEDRQRARKACVPCKSSKIRCDASLPCKNCTRKHCQNSCQYLDASTPQDLAPRPSKRAKTSSVDCSATATRSPSRPASIQDDANDEPTVSDSGPAVSEAAPLPTPSASAHSPEVTHSRMLLSSKGEKMYIGKIASLSLLQFLRQTIRLYTGPTPFSDTASKNIMLEADMTGSDESELPTLALPDQHALVECFFEASSGLLELCGKDEAQDLVNRSSSRNKYLRLSSDDRAVLLLMLAIGAQCRGKGSDLQYASTYFTKGRLLAFHDMLCDPSINMVRIFLLLAFYMLGACRRNAAFMYLGVASKAACALGLHSQSQYPNLSPQERESRRRTWKSLFVLDSLVNSILGRLSTLPPIHTENLHRQNDRNRYAKPNPLDAAYGACTHIATIVPTISKGTDLDAGFTENFLGNLGHWRQSALPSQRRYTFGLAALPGFEEQEDVLGNTHVACMYYFAVILVTRPFLLSSLTHKLRVRVKDGNMARTTSFTASDPRMLKLAQACIDAASYMTQLCQRVMESGMLLNNMCILKAFMFAAGLLLGYSCFVDGKASESEEAFQAAQAVLHKFSNLSPQARHYCEILHDFGQAISKYQKLQQEQRRRSTNQYVSQVFALAPPNQVMRNNEGSDDVSYSRQPGTASGDVGSSSATVSASGGGGGGVGSFSSFLQDNSNSNFSGSYDLINDNALGHGIEGGNNDQGNLTHGLDYASASIPFLSDDPNLASLWDDFNFDWQLFSAFPDEANIGM